MRSPQDYSSACIVCQTPKDLVMLSSVQKPNVVCNSQSVVHGHRSTIDSKVTIAKDHGIHLRMRKVVVSRCHSLVSIFGSKLVV